MENNNKFTMFSHSPLAQALINAEDTATTEYAALWDSFDALMKAELGQDGYDAWMDDVNWWTHGSPGAEDIMRSAEKALVANNS